MIGTLAGIRVVEQGTFITGPCAGMMLADLGADDMPTQERDAECKASQEVAGLFNWLCEQVGLAPVPPASMAYRPKNGSITHAVLKVQLAALTLRHHEGDRAAEMSLGFRQFDRERRSS